VNSVDLNNNKLSMEYLQMVNQKNQKNFENFQHVSRKEGSAFTQLQQKKPNEIALSPRSSP